MFAAQEAQIVARLQQQLGAILVLGSFDQVDFREAGAPQLALQVRYQGFTTLAQAQTKVKLGITWEVSVLARLASVDAALRAQATDTLAALIAALTHWPQQAGVLALRLAGGGEPEADETGALRFPVVFEGPAIVAGTSS